MSKKRKPSPMTLDHQVDLSEIILRESGEGQEPDGYSWNVVLIKAGLSKNGFYYPQATLEKSVALFEGARAFDRDNEGHQFDAGVSVKNIVGWFSNATYEAGGIRAIFHISETAPWLRSKLLEMKAMKLTNHFGLSIVASGIAARRKHQGAEIYWVEEINKVNAVDPVVFPAAGGRFLTLAASEGAIMEGNMDKLIKMIESLAPHLLKDKDLANITEDEVFVLLQEAHNHIKEKVKDPPATPPAPPGTLAVDIAEAQAKIKDLLTEHQSLISCERLLTATLQASQLPEVCQDRLRESFKQKVFTQDELTAAVTAEFSYIAKLNEGFGVKVPTPATGGVTKGDRLKAALDGFFYEADQKVDDQIIPRGRSFRELYREITGDDKLTGRISEAVRLSENFQFREGLYSGSWAQILGDSITRRMISEYQLPQLNDWRLVVSDITPIADFRSNKRMRMGGYGVIPAVEERANYTELTSPGDEEAYFSISKRGGLETLTLEMIANDDVGSIKRIPVLLGRAAARTLYKFVFDMFTANSGAGIACTYDSVNLCSTGNEHLNYATTALSAAAVTAARLLMRSQAGYGDTYEILGPALLPKYMLVPNELEELAYKICFAAVTLVSAGTTEVSNMPNIHQGLQPLVIDYWTDATNWYQVCDPASFPTFEIGFFQGREDPELFLASAPEVGSMFSADKLSYKIRHIYGGTPLDHRGITGNVVGG